MTELSPASPTGIRKSEPVPKPKSGEGNEDQDFLRQMRKRVARAEEYNRANAERYTKDLDFLIGEDRSQWDASVKAARESQKRPVLQFNLLPKFFHQVSNEIKQASPNFLVRPEQSDANTEAAEVYEGMIRHINNRSKGDQSREIAVDNALLGFGYYALTTAYAKQYSDWDDDGDPVDNEAAESKREEAEELFRKEIRVRTITNPLDVKDDPDCKTFEGSDRKWLAYEQRISREDFKARYPDAQLAQIVVDPWEDDMRGWWSDKEIRLVEYWYVEEKIKTVESNGKTRKTVQRKVCWTICTADQVLERGDWPGRWIPFIRVVGWATFLNGNLHLEGMTHQSRDPQEAYNYMRTGQVERVGLNALSPWLMAEGQDEGYASQWQEANSAAYASLKYKPVGMANGQPAPPPQRLDPPPPPADIMAAAEFAKQDLHESFGMSPSSVGQPSNQPTAKQDEMLRLESDTANFHFIRSFQFALEFEGAMLLQLIPRVYDTKQVIRILGEDSQPKIVNINPDMMPGAKRKAVVTYNDTDGNPVKHFSLGVGEYDLRVEMGPAFSTQVEKTRSELLEAMKLGGPPVAAVMMPYWVRSSQLREKDMLAELLEGMWPPALVDIKSKSAQGMDKAAVSAMRVQLAQSVQKNQQMAEQLQAMAKELGDKRAELAYKHMAEMAKEEGRRVAAIAQMQTAVIKADQDIFTTGMKTGHIPGAVQGMEVVHQSGAEGVARVEEKADKMEHGNGASAPQSQGPP